VSSPVLPRQGVPRAARTCHALPSLAVPCVGARESNPGATIHPPSLSRPAWPSQGQLRLATCLPRRATCAGARGSNPGACRSPSLPLPSIARRCPAPKSLDWPRKAGPGRRPVRALHHLAAPNLATRSLAPSSRASRCLAPARPTVPGHVHAMPRRALPRLAEPCQDSPSQARAWPSHASCAGVGASNPEGCRSPSNQDQTCLDMPRRAMPGVAGRCHAAPCGAKAIRALARLAPPCQA
jgi:hypothetical protein